MPRRPRLVAPLPQPQQFERQDADAVNAERREMAEEQHDDARRRQRHARRPHAFAQGDPAGQRPERDADAEDVVHQADEKDEIIQQAESTNSGSSRPAADQRAVERHGSRDDQREHRDHVNLAGQIDVHEPRQHRHDEVHGQVGNDLPVDLIEFGQLRVVAQRRDDLHARQMVDVVRQRRQRMGPDRDRDQQRKGSGQHSDLPAGKSVRAEPRNGRVRNDRLVR